MKHITFLTEKPSERLNPVKVSTFAVEEDKTSVQNEVLINK